MQRSRWIAVVLLATCSLAQADPQPIVRKVNGNQNSYTYHNYKKAAVKRAVAPAAKYAEVEVAAPPRLEAVNAPAQDSAPVYAVPPHLTPPPLRPGSAPVQVQDNTTTYNQDSGNYSSSIYSSGPNYGPAFYGPYSPGGYYPYTGNGCYTGGYYTSGLNTGIAIQGFYSNRNGLTVTAGFPAGGYYPGGGYNSGGYRRPAQCGPGFNLTPQRFDPGPGEHPYSIQMPRPR